MTVAKKIKDKLTNKNLNTKFSIDDAEFDQIYPKHITNISEIHWTPIKIALKAAKILVTEPNTKVLDIGSGVGKFCIIGALTTEGNFTGVEYRKSLVNVSNRIIKEFELENVKIIHSNIIDTDFSNYDAFYFFNSFYENTFCEQKDIIVDSSVELSKELFYEYSEYLYYKLESLEVGKKVLTYYGIANQIPDCYKLEYEDKKNDLQLWVKV